LPTLRSRKLCRRHLLHALRAKILTVNKLRFLSLSFLF
jgi:hypothetical protein